MFRLVCYLVGWDRRQVDVTLHRRQWFNLASCPASLPLPQAAWRTNAKPAIAAGFADDPLIVVDVGHASHRYHAGLQYLCVYQGDNIQFRAECGFNTAGGLLIQITSPEPVASKEAERLLFRLLCGAKCHLCLKIKWTTTFSLGNINSNILQQLLLCSKYTRYTE